MRYTMQSKRQFMSLLSLYREALQSKSSQAIMSVSLRLHAASGQVPQHMRRYIGHVARDVATEIVEASRG